MRFTLTYDGLLPPSASAVVKQGIRETLHPQLAELWGHDPLLHVKNYLRPVTNPETEISVLKCVAGQFYAPLVTERLGLLAELQIEMLRPEPPGALITNQGDLDNRLKTLFDALRSPVTAQEVKPGGLISSEGSPIFTLLDDDRLITRVSVETDRLLAPQDSDPYYTRLRIIIKLRASRLILGNQALVM